METTFKRPLAVFDIDDCIKQGDHDLPSIMNSLKDYVDKLDDQYDSDLFEYVEDMLRPGVVELMRVLQGRGYCIVLFTASPPVGNQSQQNDLVLQLVQSDYSGKVYEKVKNQLTHSFKSVCYQKALQKKGINIASIFSGQHRLPLRNQKSGWLIKCKSLEHVRRMLELQGIGDIDAGRMVLFDDFDGNRCDGEKQINVKTNKTYGLRAPADQRPDMEEEKGERRGYKPIFTSRYPNPKDLRQGKTRINKPENYIQHMEREESYAEIVDDVPNCEAENWYELYQCWEGARSNPNDTFWNTLVSAIEDIPNDIPAHDFHDRMLAELELHLRPVPVQSWMGGACSNYGRYQTLRGDSSWY